MKSPQEATPLDSYLRSSSEQGELDSSGSFSIHISKAIDKLARFSLPFESAWLLKCVQWGVAAGAEKIFIKLGARSTKIELRGKLELAREDLELALKDIGQTNSALGYLVAALRDVGFSRQHSFLLELPAEPGLAWDGKALNQFSGGNRNISLEVSLLPFNKSNNRLCKSHNASLLQTLTERAHTCPVPLVCDGRRLDALGHNPQHGWGVRSQPLMLGAVQGDLPTLAVPPFTREMRPSGRIHENLDKADRPKALWPENADSVALAYIVSGHLTWKDQGKNSKWEEVTGASRVYWVRDGIIIDTQEISRFHLCSVGVFVSAEGLRSDMTGFSLVDSKERNERLREIRKLLKEPLESASSWSCEKGVEAADSQMRAMGAMFIGGGVFSGAVAIVKPTLLLHSVIFIVSGATLWKSGASDFRRIVENIQAALRELPSRVRSLW